MKEQVSRPLEGAGVGLFWVLAGLTLLSQAAAFHWLGEALADLRWHLGFIALVPALPAIFLLPGRRLTFVAMALLGAFNLMPGMRIHLPPPEAEFTVGTPLSVVSVRWGAAPTDALVELVETAGPDVVVVSGLPEAEREALLEHTVAWPYVQAWPPIMADATGAPLVLTEPSTVVLSKHQLGDFHGQGFGVGACLLEAQLDIGDLPLTLRVASFPERGAGEALGARDALLTALSGQSWPARGLLVCDLARSDASSAFGALLDMTRYHDARRGFGRNPTMPAPLLGFLRVPGRYLLHGAELNVRDLHTEELAAGRREVVRVTVDDDTPRFVPLFTELRVRGVAAGADEEPGDEPGTPTP